MSFGHRNNRGEKSWSKEDIATCSSVFFLSLDILNSSSTFIFCLQIQEKIILYVLYHGIWTHEGQVWGPQMLVRYWAVTRKWFLWHCCCCLPSNGHKPTTDLSLYILYVLYVCIIKWLQSPGRMQKKKNTRELGEEKNPRFSASTLGCLDVRRCWRTLAGPHVHIRLSSYETAHKWSELFCFLGGAGF